VNCHTLINERSQIKQEILAYLEVHPESRDTLEGIVEWWLLRLKIEFATKRVEEALNELVAEGLVIKEQKRGLCSFRKKKTKESRNATNR